jgi:surface antigen
MLRSIAMVSVLALALAGCDSTGNKQTAGTVLGGLGGAVAGAQFGQGSGQIAAGVAGALIGALIGSEVGKSLDRADQAAMARTTQSALESNPTGQATPWRNPDSGNHGTITPMKTVPQSDGSVCREFNQSINVGGKVEQGYGTACRQPDGSWKIVN